jgi:hypothetical protein
MNLEPENRRSFVKKSLATSMTLTFAGLIRAHGDGGTGSTTIDPENTYVTTNSGATTTFDLEGTYYTTIGNTTTFDLEETYETTTPETTIETTIETTTDQNDGRLVVWQEANWPNNLVGITDVGPPRITKQIVPETEQGPIAYINGIPEKPDLYASVDADPETEITWTMELVTERIERNELDNRNYTGSTPAGTPWHIGAEFQEFVGGKAKATANFVFDGQPQSATASFFIRGKNPLDQDAFNYISEVNINNYQGRFWFAYGMVRHESRQGELIYNQFNTGGLLELPNLGAPDGWGIAQLDRPLGIRASTNEVYNWRANIDKFFQELVEKESFQQIVLSAYMATFPNTPAPPNNFTPPDCVTVYTALEAGTMQLYNGGAKIVRVANGQIVGAGGVAYPTAWTYNPNGGWVFHRNRNNYVRRVTLDEIEENALTAE